MGLGSKTPSLPTVLLRHELADGSWHVDWMIARDPQARQPLITFRLPSRLDELQLDHELPAERLADHRSAYLSYEGPVAGGRGRVTRLQSGAAEFLEAEPDRLRIRVGWSGRDDRGAVSHELTILPAPAGKRGGEELPHSRWVVTCTRQDSPGAAQCADRDPAATGP